MEINWPINFMDYAALNESTKWAILRLWTVHSAEAKHVLTHMDGHITIVELDGMITSTTAVNLEETLLKIAEDPDCRVLISFKDLYLLSSSGIRVLVAFAHRLRSKGGQFALCEIQDNVLKMFTVTGFDAILPIYDTREEARAAIS